ncbi:hypothetical protein SSS_10144 [Sarcoptes scabiei]|nr:hypothetical protein SSS_10144 [Sarcoptes scabiei]
MFKTSNRHRSYPSKIILIWCLLASNIVEVLCDQTNQTVLSSDISSSSVSFSSPHTNNVPKLSFSNDSNSSKEYNKSLTNITPLSTHSVHSSELSIHQESSKNEINQSSSSKSNSNETNIPTTSQTSTQTSVDPNLPHKGAAEEERHSSMAIFFVLSVIASCIFLIHFILETKFQYIPESLAVVFLGAAIGLVMKLSSHNLGDWKKRR